MNVAETELTPNSRSPSLFPDLAAYAALVRRSRLLLLLSTLLFALAGLAIALLTRPVYRAELVIAPTQSGGGSAVSRLAGQFAGMAALAGIAIDPGDNLERSIAILSSRALAEKFIKDNNLLPALFETRWDAKSRSWLEEEGGEPSYWLAAKRFDRIRSVSRDVRSGIITVSFEWYDRAQAASWANAYISLANDQMRAGAISEANASIASLKKQLQESELLEMKNIIYGLLESHVSKLTLAEARPDFAFTIVDPAVTPDRRAFIRPKRLATIFLSAMAGMIVGLLIMIIRDIVPRSEL